MYSREHLLRIHSDIQTYKEHVWHHHGAPDMFPVMVVRWRDLGQNVAVRLDQVGDVIERLARRLPPDHWLNSVEMADPRSLFLVTVKAISLGIKVPGLDQAKPKDAPLEAVWCAVEGYSASADTIDEVHERAGHLQDEFRDNPAADIKERLTTYIIETSSTGLAEFARITTNFHKDDGGVIVWGDPTIWSSEPELVSGEDELLLWQDSIIDGISPYVTREKLT